MQNVGRKFRMSAVRHQVAAEAVVQFVDAYCWTTFMRTGSRMWTRDEIAAAVSCLGVRASELKAEEALSVERRAEVSFARPGHGPLWERLLNDEGFHDENAWRSIGEFAAGPATLFVRDAQGLCAFRFEDGRDLVTTIGSCPGFEFYVVDDSSHFLLSFNGHDVLIGCGSATEWVRNLRQKAEQRDPTP